MLDLQDSALKQCPDSVGFATKYSWPQRIVVHDLNLRRHFQSPQSPLRIAASTLPVCHAGHLIRNLDKFRSRRYEPQTGKRFSRAPGEGTGAVGQHIPSELETRMIYLTESDNSCESQLELNEEFEAKCDTAEYEPKISRLLYRAYKRLKDENPEKSRNSNLAIRTLRKGDHYVLVLWDVAPQCDHPIRDFFKPIGIGVLIAIGIFIARIGFLMVAFAWTRWWNTDWQRFIKLYGVSGPPYRGRLTGLTGE